MDSIYITECKSKPPWKSRGGPALAPLQETLDLHVQWDVQ